MRQWANEETELHEFGDSWDTYRHMVRSGISTIAEIQIRNLFQELSLIQSHAEARLAILCAIRDRKKLDLELERGRLLRVFNTGAMNKRIVDVEGNEAYQKKSEELEQSENEVTISKGFAVAATIAANALSRELTMRKQL